MLPDIAVIVPTYWTRPGRAGRTGDAVYDHPTPLDEEGTLGRLLQSLLILDASRFYVLVLVAVTSSEVTEAARASTMRIVESVPHLTALVVSQPEVDLIISRAHETEGADKLLGLQGYARVRNVQLAVPYLLGSEVVVALDDDEVVTDPRFLDRAVEGLCAAPQGRSVDGIGGYYTLDETGRIILDDDQPAASDGNVFDRKAALMNAATRRLEELPDRLVPTPFCFGGNMVFSRSLIAAVGFDPAITRGEDIDYLINARLAGRWFFMNKDLRVLHLPPPGTSYKDIAHHKVVQDVLRFVYEREKLRRWSDLGAEIEVTPQELAPYPGDFLTDTLDQDALEVVARIFDALDPERRTALGLVESPAGFMRLARQRADVGAAAYRGHQETWRRLTARLKGDADLASDVLGRARVGRAFTV